MGVHRLFLDDGAASTGPRARAASWAVGDSVFVGGDEAHHAVRVKRIGPGERCELVNGRGVIAAAAVMRTGKARGGDWEIELRIDGVRTAEPVRPRVEVFTAPPKGARLEEMIDQLSQVGAAKWSPLVTEHTVVEPRAGKMERVRRAAVESAKQCARAWVMEIGESADLARVTLDASVVVAHADGVALSVGGVVGDRVTILVGPEGGWSARELNTFRSAGVRMVSFGPHIMRIETAAVAAAAIVLDAARARPSGGTAE